MIPRPDVHRCWAVDCERRLQCFRFLAWPEPGRTEAILEKPPYEADKKTCSMFIEAVYCNYIGGSHDAGRSEGDGPKAR